MNAEDKTSIPGYIYFRDNEMDYKIGLTNNLVVRGRAYKTENPRDTVVDYFFVETYAEAEAIEAEMKQTARAEGLCSFDNSDEWLKRTDATEAFWNKFVEKYARKTKAEWADSGVNESLRAECNKAKRQWQWWHDDSKEKEKEISKLIASRHLLQGFIAKLRHHIDDLESENYRWKEQYKIVSKGKEYCEILIPF